MNKDSSVCGSLRSITVCSIIKKLLEKALSPLINVLCNFCDHQFGFRSGIGIQNAHAVFLGAIDRNHLAEESLYVCTLDISKAFDSVLHSYTILPLLGNGVNSLSCVLVFILPIVLQ
jgi:hypothetical protein